MIDSKSITWKEWNSLKSTFQSFFSSPDNILPKGVSLCVFTFHSASKMLGLMIIFYIIYFLERYGLYLEYYEHVAASPTSECQGNNSFHYVHSTLS